MWWTCWLALFVLAGWVRLLLFYRFPAFPTNDSSDYLRAAQQIATSLDFTNRELRDWRAPGYPIFLAVLYWLGGWSTGAMVLAQKLAGLCSVALGVVAATHLGWRWGALVLGAFLAFHPVYLLYEHMLMGETLFLALIWGVVALVVRVLRARQGRAPGLALGAVMAGCILTRSPGLMFCAPVALALCVHLWIAGRRPGHSSRHGWKVALGLAIGLGLVMAPWSYRNYLLFGTFNPLTNNVQRTMLAYMYLNDVTDKDLPAAIGTGQVSENARIAAGELVRGLGADAAAEGVAAHLVRRQIATHRGAYADSVVTHAGHFLGLGLRPAPPGSSDVTYWFQVVVPRASMMTQRNRAVLRSARDLEYFETGRQGRIVMAWSDVGQQYLDWGRRLLTIAFSVAFVSFLVVSIREFRRKPRPEFGLDSAALSIFVLGFLSVVAGHAALLAGKERYSTPWDGIAVLVIVGTGEFLWRRRQRRLHEPVAADEVAS